jgi:hypothetical protein
MNEAQEDRRRFNPMNSCHSLSASGTVRRHLSRHELQTCWVGHYYLGGFVEALITGPVELQISSGLKL